MANRLFFLLTLRLLLNRSFDVIAICGDVSYGNGGRKRRKAYLSNDAIVTQIEFRSAIEFDNGMYRVYHDIDEKYKCTK